VSPTHEENDSNLDQRGDGCSGVVIRCWIPLKGIQLAKRIAREREISCFWPKELGDQWHKIRM
jgi:hypothetical protein